MSRWILLGLGLLLVAGCGGGRDDPIAPVGAASPAPLAQAAGPSAALVSADMTLDWAEYRFADLFDTSHTQRWPSITYQETAYNARLYAGAWGDRYLGITTDGRVFGLGDFTQGSLQQFDDIAHWAPQILQDWCAVRPSDCTGGTAGYGGATPVAPAVVAIDDTAFSDDGAALVVALADGSRVDVGVQAAGFAMQLEREAGSNAELRTALAQHPALQATGSVRGLYMLGSKNTARLMPTITIPAQDAAGLNPDTLMAMRLGPAVVNGEMVFDHVALLPVSRDAKGQLSVVDPLFRDGVNPSLAALPASAKARALRARARSDAIDYEWVGGARYVLTSFQNDLNWTREPALVRMLPDAALSASGWRRPATANELLVLAREPVCNLVLLVHGHNETEKAGDEAASEAAPWLQAYKKRVWDLLYQTALSNDVRGQALYPHRCTAFYEFIFPSYRAIFSPVSAKGGGVQETLGEALGRLVGEELARNPQLAALLASGMPLNTVIVGHSQGGLVARAGLRFMPEAFKSRVRRLVTWGTPHHGAAIYSMRYAMQSGHDLVIDGYRLPLQNLVQGGVVGIALDTPGIRDLRLDARHRSAMNLRAIFPSLDASAEAALAPTLFSSNLGEFNTNVGTREIDPGPAYTFITGSKLRSATLEPEDTSGAWWLQFRGQQVSRFATSTGTEQGAALNRLLMKSGFQASDGAAPVFSQQAVGIVGPETVDMGDIDHEEFYGSEPPQRNAASLFKGRLTAERSLHEGRLDAATSACPSLQGLSLQSGPGTLRVSGKVQWPGLAATPTQTGAMVKRVEARAGSGQGAVIAALALQHDAAGQFSGTATASAVPLGPLVVVAVLQDGSELQGVLSNTAASDFVAARLFEQPWTVTENREGLLRAQLTRSDNGSSLQCTLAVTWTLPTAHAQPLQVQIVRLLKADGATRNDAFFVSYLSYAGRVMSLGDGRFASRQGQLVDPATTLTRTDQGMQRVLSYLPPERLESVYLERSPTLYLEVKGLCGASDTTQIRFDYQAPR